MPRPRARRLSHMDERGAARMVDVGAKPHTVRRAVARATVSMKPTTLALIRKGMVPKGDAIATARIAGIMAAKRTPEIIPLCHPIAITSVTVDFKYRRAAVEITASVTTVGQTGVEMEALTAAAAAALAIYDMCKAADKDMVIGDVMLMEKSGGRSGHYRRKA